MTLRALLLLPLACALALPACGRQATYRAQAQGSAQHDADPDAQEEDADPDAEEDAEEEGTPDAPEPTPDAEQDAPDEPWSPSQGACALEALPLEEWPPNTQALWSRHVRGDVYPQTTVASVSDDGEVVLTLQDARGVAWEDGRWEAGSADGAAGALKVSPDGTTRWALRLLRVEGSPDQLGQLEHLSAAPDGHLLATLSWSGELQGPSGTLFQSAALDRWSGLFLSINPDGTLDSARELSLDSNTVCQTALPTADGGWLVSCFGGAGVGLAMRLDADLSSRWELATRAREPAPGQTYAYLFQNTEPVAGLTFLDVWRNADAYIGDRLAPLDPGDASGTLVAAVRADSGQVAWVQPPPTGARLLLSSPEAGLALAHATDLEAKRLWVLGLDPSGQERWRCGYPIHERGSLNLRPTLSGRSLLLEGVEDNQGTQSFLALVDPSQGFEVTRAVRLPLLHESAQINEAAGVLVVSLVLPQGRTTLFGRTFDAQGSYDRAILALPWPPR